MSAPRNIWQWGQRLILEKEFLESQSAGRSHNHRYSKPYPLASKARFVLNPHFFELLGYLSEPLINRGERTVEFGAQLRKLGFQPTFHRIARTCKSEVERGFTILCREALSD